MTIGLQGGSEFGPECRDMDKALLRRSERGAVVLLPLGEEPGEAYDKAGQAGIEWFQALGEEDVTVAPDPRPGGPATDAEAAGVVREASAVILAGSSVDLTLAALTATSLGDALRESATSSAVVVGATAGARALCEWTVLDNGSVGPGLGLVPGCAVLSPYTTGSRPEWVADLPDGILVLGLRACSGVAIDGDRVTALGGGRTSLLNQQGTLAVLDPDTTREGWWIDQE